MYTDWRVYCYKVPAEEVPEEVKQENMSEEDRLLEQGAENVLNQLLDSVDSNGKK